MKDYYVFAEIAPGHGWARIVLACSGMTTVLFDFVHPQRANDIACRENLKER